jgi:Zn-dependent protease with chaperone function
MKKLQKIGAIISAAFMPLITKAAELNLGLEEVEREIALPSEDIRVVITRIINVAMGFLGIVAVLIILWGGFTWMTAGGNEEKVGEAKKIITAGIIGLIIVISSYAIARFVVQSLVNVA